MMRAWLPPILAVLPGAYVATGLIVEGNPGAAEALLPAFLSLALVFSPLIFPRSVGAPEAQRRSAADGRPVVFWRPGCAYCLRLRIRLGRGARRAHRVDIWRYPAGAAVVRAANDGNETVPTVVVAGLAHTHPDPGWVREQLPPSRLTGRRALVAGRRTRPTKAPAARPGAGRSTGRNPTARLGTAGASARR